MRFLDSHVVNSHVLTMQEAVTRFADHRIPRLIDIMTFRVSVTNNQRNELWVYAMLDEGR